MAFELTDEQRQVIGHPDARHALVLAGAGSGKTTTMAYRIQHFVNELEMRPHEIRVLMFNTRARAQFQNKLKELELGEDFSKQVQTFHSAAYRVINDQRYEQWLGDFEEREHLNLKRIVDRIRADKNLGEEDINVGEARRAIGLWKGALIQPNSAGYSGRFGDAYVDIYKRFEDARLKANAITFDDFVPLAVRQLQRHPDKREHFVGGVRYIIVDEYQDVNLGHQKLVEILASGGADVMVVGDDDQTIYEWRGARSDYIRREFPNSFPGKPHSSYKLTSSFRFGFLISQSSYNVITHNTDRQPKDLLTHKPDKDSEVHILTGDGQADESANRALADEIEILVKEKVAAPTDIRVLGRTYSQLNGLQSEMMLRKIPFKVEGRSTFLASSEVNALLDYIRVAASFNQPLSKGMQDRLATIANKPSRFLARRSLGQMLDAGMREGLSLADLLTTALETDRWFDNARQKERLGELADFLEALCNRLQVERDEGEDERIGILLEWVDERIGFRDHYRDYYGEGEDSENRINNIRSLIRYAHQVKLGWRDFLTHVRESDSTLGLPEEKLIQMTTIHRVKGLEFDYVFIPDCAEGFLPVKGSNDDPTYDTREPQRMPRPAEWIENERRLFYVGATRAREALYIGAPRIRTGQVQTNRTDSPSGGHDDEAPSLSSRFLEEMELQPTREVAEEVVKAANGESSHRLVEVVAEFAKGGRKKIADGVKHIGHIFPGSTPRQIAAVEESTAERPFHYVQTYDSPVRRPKETDEDPEVWPHIDLNRRQREAAPRRTVLPPKRHI